MVSVKRVSSFYPIYTLSVFYNSGFLGCFTLQSGSYHFPMSFAQFDKQRWDITTLEVRLGVLLLRSAQTGATIMALQKPFNFIVLVYRSLNKLK